MVRSFSFLKRFERNIIDTLLKEKISLNLFYYKNMRIGKNSFFRKKNKCFLCEKYLVEKGHSVSMFQFDNHNFDHAMFSELPNHIPIKFHTLSIDEECFSSWIHMQKNFPILENFCFFLLGNKVLRNEFFYYTNYEKRNKEYIFLKFRISMFWKKFPRKQFNWKNILHGWRELKKPQDNWISQRGEFFLGFPEKCFKKKNGIKKIFLWKFYRESVFFLRYFNKKTYELELIKKIIAFKFAPKILFFQNLIELERLHIFNLYNYLENIFFYTIWKVTTTDTNFLVRFSFFDNFFYSTPNANNHVLTFIRSFLKCQQILKI